MGLSTLAICTQSVHKIHAEKLHGKEQNQEIRFLVQYVNIKIIWFTVSRSVSPFHLETKQKLTVYLSSMFKYDNDCRQQRLQEHYFPSNACLKMGHTNKNTHRTSQKKQSSNQTRRKIYFGLGIIHALEIPGDREVQIRPVKMLKLNEKVQKQAQTASHYRLKNAA